MAGWVALAAMAVLQVASSRAGHLEIFVTLIVALLAVASVSFTAIGPGWPRALSAGAAAFALGLAAEWAGTRTGFPFGAYRYTGLLRPAAGTVPLVVPLAWAAMGLPGYGVGTSIARSRAGRIAAGAVALTAWDLFARATDETAEHLAKGVAIGAQEIHFSDPPAEHGRQFRPDELARPGHVGGRGGKFTDLHSHDPAILSAGCGECHYREIRPSRPGRLHAPGPPAGRPQVLTGVLPPLPSRPRRRSRDASGPVFRWDTLKPLTWYWPLKVSE